MKIRSRFVSWVQKMHPAIKLGILLLLIPLVIYGAIGARNKFHYWKVYREGEYRSSVAVKHIGDYRKGLSTPIVLEVTNQGKQPWGEDVSLGMFKRDWKGQHVDKCGVFIYLENGKMSADSGDGNRIRFSGTKPVMPGSSCLITFFLRAPDNPDHATLHFQLVKERPNPNSVNWFGQEVDVPLSQPLE